MQNQPNATSGLDPVVEGLVGTRCTLMVCVACGHDRIHTPRQETCCPECGASPRRSFALLRDLRQLLR